MRVDVRFLVRGIVSIKVGHVEWPCVDVLYSRVNIITFQFILSSSYLCVNIQKVFAGIIAGRFFLNRSHVFTDGYHGSIAAKLFEVATRATRCSLHKFTHVEIRCELDIFQELINVIDEYASK